MCTTQSELTSCREGMAETLDLIRLELLSQYERSGQINIGEWVSRYPAHRSELIDFWMWLKEAPSADNDVAEILDHSDIEVNEEAVQNICLAVTLGREWLKPGVETESGSLDRLADELGAIRAKPLNVRDARLPFRKAVVCTWVVAQLQQKRPRVTRLAAQKVTYLLEQAMALGIFVQHKRKPLGPYDSSARYTDAEPIARQKGWLQVNGTELRASEDISGINRFVPGYLRSQEVATRLVDALADFSDAQLESIATTLWIAHELKRAEKEITSASVAGALAATPEWKPKLARQNFSATHVEGALTFLRQLRLIDAS